MINLNDFDEVYNYFKGTIKYLVNKYKIYSYENHILEKLWIITIDLDTSIFKNFKDIENYIFVSLKNFCIYLLQKEKLYLEKNLLCSTNEIFFTNKIIINENFSDIIYDDLISKLTPREKLIIDYKFKNNFSDIKIAKILGISRQAVNKSIKKSIGSLRRYV